ncbi:MAG: MFS transporter [Anaerolineales bacterium]|jgi:DHA1 family multidrug resistance protein-like MFS transporter
MTSNRHHLFILFGTLVVVMMGFGMVIPLLGFYVKLFSAGGAALGLLMSSYAVTQFFCAPIWGNLSDRFGRKPILALGILGNAISQLWFGLATQLWMLFAARILAGVLSSATLPTAMAYIGDTTSEEERGGGMGILGAAMGVGMVIGPGLGGLLAKDSLSRPFFLAAGLSFLALVLVYIYLPESLAEEKRTTAKLKVGSQFGTMIDALNSPIRILLIVTTLMSFGLTNFESVFSLYALERYAYGPGRVGFILMLIGLTSAIVQAALTGPLSRSIGEVNILRGSLFVSAIGFVAMTLAQSYAWVIATTLFFILGNAMLRPATASLISKRTPSGQGISMGLNNSFMSLGRILGPLWAGFVFDLGFQLPYYSGALMMTLGLVVSVFLLEGKRSNPQTQPVDVTESL